MEKVANLEAYIPRRTLADEFQGFNFNNDDEPGNWACFMWFEPA
jgi:hypothetical protein